jgi:hypothetical protein
MARKPSEPKVKKKFQCGVCKQTITVSVPLSSPPVCTRHTGGGRKMTEVML